MKMKVHFSPLYTNSESESELAFQVLEDDSDDSEFGYTEGL